MQLTLAPPFLSSHSLIRSLLSVRAGTDARLHGLSVEPEARVRGLTFSEDDGSSGEEDVSSGEDDVSRTEIVKSCVRASVNVCAMCHTAPPHSPSLISHHLLFSFQCQLARAGDVTYNSLSAQVLYAVQENPDIVVSFNAPPVNPTTPPESVEAVVWPGKKDGEVLSCDYNQPYYLGKTAGASLNNPGTANEPFPTLLWPVEIVPGTGSNNYDVKIDTTFFTDPATPGYSESRDTGWAYMCIEFQQFACGFKVDFATVLLEIKYNLESECSICSIAEITREGPVNDGGEVLAPPLECVVGNPEDEPFNQGDAVEICIQYPEDYRNDDVCFNYLTEFEAKLWQRGNPDHATANLLNIAGSGFQQIGDTTCLDQFDTEPSPPMYGRSTYQIHLISKLF